MSMLRSLLCLTICTLALVVGPGSARGDDDAPEFIPGLATHYYRDTAFWGGNWPDDVSAPRARASAWTFTAYSYTRVEPIVNHLFIRRGWFSVRWQGYLDTNVGVLAGKNAAYYLQVWADDGCRLWVDDRLVIDSWIPMSEDSTDARRTAAVSLRSGRHKIRLEYFQGQSLAADDEDPIKLYWASPELNMPIQIISDIYLFHTVDDLEPTPGRND